MFNLVALCSPEYSSGWPFQDQYSSMVSSTISWAARSRFSATAAWSLRVVAIKGA